eukprot:CAMPEP_0198652554 /NCGR_PEP_ID=MMETSP1467-20131203/6466_1 /TAXON_ID=1462469 /ORGANISM="unid. sp., Strain CCMP2135" /LENGTH=216 /DNA_ID=CAMNT_0044388483 /DNA_START=265 /DNA_END=915 /DNA_ORIENTATION=-
MTALGCGTVGPNRPTLRLVVTGDSGSGKTSLIRRYVNNYFPKRPQSSHGLGLDHAVKLVTLKQGGPVILQISEDEATSKKVAHLSNYGYNKSTVCQRANGAVMVFDPTTGDEALGRVASRKAQFDSDVTFRTGDFLPVVLVANKSDLTDRRIDRRALDLFCANNNFVAWFEISAKTGDNVDTAFASLAQNIMAVQDRWDPEVHSIEEAFFEHCACG